VSPYDRATAGLDGHITEPRLPYTALARAAGTTNQTVLARLLGIQVRQVVRYAAGDVPCTRADHLACAIGRHPLEVWGADWTEACDRYDAARSLRHDLALRRRYDRRQIMSGGPNRTWDELARSWAQWAAQRDRVRFDAAAKRAETIGECEETA